MELTADRPEISVLFCDLAGFSGMAERHDAEDVMLVLREYWHACQDVVETTFQGQVSQQILGDGYLPSSGSLWPMMMTPVGLSVPPLP